MIILGVNLLNLLAFGEIESLANSVDSICVSPVDEVLPHDLDIIKLEFPGTAEAQKVIIIKTAIFVCFS